MKPCHACAGALVPDDAPTCPFCGGCDFAPAAPDPAPVDPQPEPTPRDKRRK